MGFFRKHKASKHTLAEAKKEVAQARDRIIAFTMLLHKDPSKMLPVEANFMKNKTPLELSAALDEGLKEWGQWRELQARLEGANETTEDTQ